MEHKQLDDMHRGHRCSLNINKEEKKMAQIKTLKFNDNVLQVDSSYVIQGTTFIRSNIQIGSFHIADDCGAILHFDGNDTSLQLQDSCGTTCISLHGGSNSDASIDMRSYDGNFIYLATSCGEFVVRDSYNSTRFMSTRSNIDNTDAIAIGSYGPMVGDLSGNLSIYDENGTRLAVFSSVNGGTSIDLINHEINDSCGFSIEDNCGRTIFQIPDGKYVDVESDGTLKLKSMT